MSFISFINRTVDKAETEAYCMVYIKYRKLILDILMVLFLIVSLILRNGSLPYMFLMAASMIALFRLEQTIFEIVKERKTKNKKGLQESSVLKETKKIINEHIKHNYGNNYGKQ